MNRKNKQKKYRWKIIDKYIYYTYLVNLPEYILFNPISSSLPIQIDYNRSFSFKFKQLTIQSQRISRYDSTRKIFRFVSCKKTKFVGGDTMNIEIGTMYEQQMVDTLNA
jgi:hypothetical protein